MSFISEPVTIGFTAGAVIIIASGQLKNLLGVTGVSEGDDFLEFMQHFFMNISTIRWGDATLGVVCLIILVTLRVSMDISIMSAVYLIYKSVFPIKILEIEGPARTYFMVKPNLLD